MTEVAGEVPQISNDDKLMLEDLAITNFRCITLYLESSSKIWNKEDSLALSCIEFLSTKYSEEIIDRLSYILSPEVVNQLDDIVQKANEIFLKDELEIQQEINELQESYQKIILEKLQWFN